ncbi:MAG: efflux RND transporter periplasmic adaptor subunit [Chloroflexia bacterium]|nr:efflux RND transporter periplasmic adaptor subunit [Chloroflexia bacterium]
MKTLTKLTILLPIIVLSACSDKKVAVESDDAVQVTTAYVYEKQMVEPIHSVGKVYSKAEAKLAFKTGGIIKNILVDEGQVVRKGQVLAVLNLSEIEATKNQALLAYEKAERDYKRAQNLFKDSVATLEQLENAKTQLEYAKSTLEIANFNMEYSRIVAPENGKILKRLAERNELIGSGYPVFIFGSSTDDWVVRANISESQIFSLTSNDKAKVKLDAYPNLEIEADLTEIGTFADPYTGTYEIELTIRNKDITLASGLFARFDILPSKTELYDVIPVNSLVEANEREGFVYKVSDDNIVEREKVNIIDIHDDIMYVQSELVKGDQVITEGSGYINSNSKIEIVTQSNQLVAK